MNKTHLPRKMTPLIRMQLNVFFCTQHQIRDDQINQKIYVFFSSMSTGLNLQKRLGPSRSTTNNCRTAMPSAAQMQRAMQMQLNSLMRSLAQTSCFGFGAGRSAVRWGTAFTSHRGFGTNRREVTMCNFSPSTSQSLPLDFTVKIVGWKRAFVVFKLKTNIHFREFREMKRRSNLLSWTLLPFTQNAIHLLHICFEIRKKYFIISLPISAQRNAVVMAPGCSARRTSLRVKMSLALQSSVLPACSRQSTQFTVLVYRVTDPVNACVVANSLVSRVYKNHFKILVDGILVDPVRVQHPKATAFASYTFFCQVSKVPCWLELGNTLIHWFAVHNTLVHRLFTATSADTHAVHNVSLLRLEAHATSFIRPAGSIQTNNAWQLPVFPASNAQKEAENIALLLFPKLFDVLRTN